MTLKSTLAKILFCAFPFFLQAQIEGDAVFSQNQVLTIELEFSQPGFWDSLTTNYETSTYMKADLTLTDLTGTTTFTDVGVRLKGNSSYSHPGNKKSFKIDFNKYVSGQNYDGLKKLNFSNGFKDPTLLREKIFFDVCREAEVAAPRANFANVYFNGELWGFYTVVEQIDDQFLDWKILDDDGNLFKAGDNFGGGGPGGGGGGNNSAADLAWYGEAQSAYEERYELKSNEDENDWSDLIDLIDFINNSDATTFETGLAERMELDEYIRSVALDNLFANLDSYTESARNYYLYHNLTTDKWHWIKWDGNEAFGTYAPGFGGQNIAELALDFHGNTRPLLDKLFNSTALYSQYQDELCSLIDTYFNSAWMNAYIDDLKDLVEASVLADNNKMYSNAQFQDNIENNISGGGGPGGGGPGGGTVYGLKSFVAERNAYVNNALDCSFIIMNTNEADAYALSVFPNPARTEVAVTWTEAGFSDLVVFNSLGERVLSLDISGSTQAALDVSHLAKGAYYLTLQSAQGTASRKLILLGE